MASSSIELKRHFSELSSEETDEVVGAVADLIVRFLKGKRGTDVGVERERGQTSEREHERDDEQP